MGGPGSGRWGPGGKPDARRIVEDCRRFALADLVGRSGWGVWRWSDGARLAATLDPGRETLALSYVVSDEREPTEERFEIVRPGPGLGPLRLVRCPCGRSAKFLYLPPGATRFRCRRCLGLVHRSNRESRRWEAVIRQMGGVHPRVVRRLCRRWDVRPRPLDGPLDLTMRQFR